MPSYKEFSDILFDYYEESNETTEITTATTYKTPIISGYNSSEGYRRRIEALEVFTYFLNVNYNGNYYGSNERFTTTRLLAVPSLYNETFKRPYHDRIEGITTQYSSLYLPLIGYYDGSNFIDYSPINMGTFANRNPSNIRDKVSIAYYWVSDGGIMATEL